ncbi:hypothetical protein [Salipiger marinus]|uniref:Uncharacterized protein n=1 Tax=Salipiger marinus TaxID=555512 RepID=A0A1G8PUJ2_9RHOB|nr:hypothetical protein [Salipiger marinus]SDI96184.1 hypothetical protein SAMN04487993_1013129 [Salipiger marinus]
MSSLAFSDGHKPIPRDTSDAAWRHVLEAPFDRPSEAANVAALLDAGRLVPRPADWSVPFLQLPHTPR